MEKATIRFMWNCKGPKIAISMLKKKNKIDDFTLLSLKTYYKLRESKLCDPGIGITYRSMERNCESRNKAVGLWSIDVDKGAQMI